MSEWRTLRQQNSCGVFQQAVKDFSDIGERFAPVDLALIGAYEQHWFMRPVHISPADAAKIHIDLERRQPVAMHWGTFQLTAEFADEPPRQLAAALDAADIPASQFSVFKHGETRRF